MLNALLGKKNQKIDRVQTVLTRGENDAISLIANTSFRDADIEEIRCGDSSTLRCTFKEGTYQDHIDSFDVAPHLSGYMLGYSKMLMVGSFQFVAEIGAQSLYTDTDSHAFVATAEQWALYKERFVPIEKTLGGMDLEGAYKRMRVAGPKKNICEEASKIADLISEYADTEEYAIELYNLFPGDYVFVANGVRASEVTKIDIGAEFNKVLNGEQIQLNHFSILGTSDFELHHTTEAKKTVRFLCLKGQLNEDKKGLSWWNTESEFCEHAKSLKPIGWADTVGETKDVEMTVSTMVPARPLKKKADSDEKTPTKRQKTAAVSDFVVYILCNDLGHSYIGMTNDMSQRLRRHNGELKGLRECVFIK